MNNINQIQDIIKSWNIEEKQYEKVQELKTEILKCSEMLGGIREELTKAYIVSNKIVIEKEGGYHVMQEQAARDSGEKDKDLDKKQRKEEQILNDVYRLCEAKENIINKAVKVELKEDKKFYDKASSNILYRMIKTLKKLIKKFTNLDSKIDDKKQYPSTSEETIDEGIRIVKLYKGELLQRAEKVKGMEEIQEQVNRYNSRIVEDIKGYNKQKSPMEKAQRIIAENRRDFTK